MSRSSRTASRSQAAQECFYKLLRVPRDASPQDIKASYRKLALELHPDRHNGCHIKLAQFKRVNEAYSVLSDWNSRREYDHSRGRAGGGFDDFVHDIHNRASNHSFYGRKVYAPSPPPEWQTVWNFQKHYDMHYGDGFMREAFERLKKEAEKSGEFEYKSPLGKGFSFDYEPSGGGSGSGGGDGKSNNSSGYSNPYSKRSPQGPPKMVFEYEETYVDMSSGRENILRKERIIQDLHSKRQQRRKQQQQNAQSNSSSSGSSSSERPRPMTSQAFHAAYGGGSDDRTGKSTSGGGSSDCVIL